MKRSFCVPAILAMLAVPGVRAQQPDAARAGPIQPLPVPPTMAQDIGAPSPTQTRAGTIARFTHAPTGEIDGFVLSGGVIVHYPVYLSRQVTQLLGDQRQVSVTGLLARGILPRAEAVLEAQTITNLGTRQMLTVTGSDAAEPGAVTSAGRGATAPSASATAARPAAAR